MVKVLENFLRAYAEKTIIIKSIFLKNNKFFDLKTAHMLLFYKKDDVDNKENYHPVSNLSNFSKIFERMI